MKELTVLGRELLSFGAHAHAWFCHFRRCVKAIVGCRERPIEVAVEKTLFVGLLRCCIGCKRANICLSGGEARRARGSGVQMRQ